MYVKFHFINYPYFRLLEVPLSVQQDNDLPYRSMIPPDVSSRNYHPEYSIDRSIDRSRDCRGINRDAMM